MSKAQGKQRARMGRNQAGKRRLGMKLDLSHTWTPEPTPTSVRREQAEARRRRADEEVRRQAVEATPRPATGDRPLTPAEVTQVAEMYTAGLVRRAGDQRVRDVPAVVLLKVDDDG